MKINIILRKNGNLKITIATAPKTKKFRIVVEAVEKMQKKGKGTEKELLYFLFTFDPNIFAQTFHPQIKKAKIFQFGWF